MSSGKRMKKMISVSKEGSRHLLRRYSPPVSVNAIFEVQHSQPPDIHIEHVIIEDILWKKRDVDT